MIIHLTRHPTTGEIKPGFYVMSERLYYNKKLKRRQRKNLGGPYRSLQQAQKRLHDVEAWKHMK